VYLAAGAIVMGNIPVGDGAVINAGSVVTKPVRPYTRVGGVPGREIAEFTINQTSIAVMAQMMWEEENLNDFPKSYTDTWGV
jgi:serine acetyltransferase